MWFYHAKKHCEKIENNIETQKEQYNLLEKRFHIFIKNIKYEKNENGHKNK